MQDQYDETYIEAHFQEYCRCCLKNNARKANKHKKFLDNNKLASIFYVTFGIDVSTISSQPFLQISKVYPIPDHRPRIPPVQCLQPMLQNAAGNFRLSQNLSVHPSPTHRDQTENDSDQGRTRSDGRQRAVFVDLKIKAMPPSQSQSDGAEEPMVKEPKPTGEKPKSGRRLVQCPECGALVQQHSLKGNYWRRLATGSSFFKFNCNL
jgi:hypothetical protein